METTALDGLTIFFDPDERDTATLIRRACKRTLGLVRTHWGLDPPNDCRVYVMTSWFRFLYQSAPWYWWFFAGPTMPFWFLRVKKIWRFVGGWTQRYARWSAIGVKPPRLIKQGGVVAWLGAEPRSPVPGERITPLGSCRASRDWSSC